MSFDRPNPLALEETHTILIIDDQPANLAMLSALLHQQGFRVLVSEDGESGLERAQYAHPDLIVLDVRLPGIDGIETCHRLKADERTWDIPVLFMSAAISLEEKLRGFEAGAVDYISKPVQPVEMLARIKVQLRLQEQSRRLHQQATELEQANQQLEQANQQLERANRQLEILSVTDSLTNCYNRRHFMHLAEVELEKAKRSGRPLAVLMLDVDHFKQWNDRFGHLLGDAVLQNLVTCCQQNIRTGDIFARYGGEEFVILMPETNQQNAQTIAERLLENIHALRIDTPQEPIGITVSIGVIALEDARSETVDGLIGRTDMAMYAAKEAGRARIFFQS